MTDIAEISPNLGLPFYQTKLNEFEVQHNEALLVLDALVMLAVIDRDLSAPPSSPAVGDRYLVKATGTGDFAGRDNRIAQYDIGGWNFYAPREGWTCYVCDEHTMLAWNGTSWEPALDLLGDISELQELDLLGIGTTADATNPLAAKLNNVLWVARALAEGGDGSLRYKLSKESAADTVSLLFQDDFSGRAEIGLTGDDDFHFKTSADGSTWTDALTLSKSTGAAKLNSALHLTGDIAPSQITADQNDYDPSGQAAATVLRLSTDASRNLTGLAGGANGRAVAIVNVGASAIVLKDESAGSSAANRFTFGADVTIGAKQSALLWYDSTDARWKMLSGPVAGAGGREVLTASRSYYVRTDGSDGNNGLSNSSGGAFLTIQKAIDVTAALDLSTYNVTISVGAGTYTGANTLRKLTGAGKVTIVGDTSTPSNVLISTTSSVCFTCDGATNWVLDGMKLTTTTSGNAIHSLNRGTVQFQRLDFGAVPSSSYHLRSESGGYIEAIGDYAITGGAASHMLAAAAGRIDVIARTVTLSGSITFGTTFVQSTRLSLVRANANAYTGGTITGVRYLVNSVSQIFTNGGGASYFPGNSSGTADGATFGVYN